MILILIYFFIFADGDLVFTDFNDTSGLIFNADAATSNCDINIYNLYSPIQGKNDLFDTYNFTNEYSENDDLTSELTIETNNATSNTDVNNNLAGYNHRNDTLSSPSTCNVRVRLTPSEQAKHGSMWFREEISVNDGFDTYFTFQITDHSKECTLHRDHYFSKIHHKSCSVRGGDGFAFVIQLDPNTTSAVGDIGAQMGFGGILNSIAIAFDIWSNPGDDKLAVDHVSIQSRGEHPNDALEPGLLGTPRPYSLADGEIHLVRIVYHNSIQVKYLNKLVASQSLLPFLLGNGEHMHIGSLSVFLDEGIANDTPLLTMPINLSKTLNLPADKAYVGFTASTGKHYAKHDILSWIMCDQDPCNPAMKSDFDYRQQSRFSSATITNSVPYYP